MKKYLLGFFAFALAIGFSAFTAIPKASKKSQDNLHWYRTDVTGATLQSSLGQIPKASIEGLTGCDNSDDDFCARGYTSAQSLGTAPVPSADVFMEKE